MKRVFIFVGHIGCGKGAACAYIHETYGAASFRFSTMLRDVARRYYLPEDRDHLIRISEIMRREFGEDVMAKTMMNDIIASGKDLVCVDGARRLADYLPMSGMVLVKMEAEPRIRFERLASRHQNTDDATKTFEQFLLDEQRSTEKSIDDLAAHATETIYNNGTPEELHAALDALIKKYSAA